MSTSLEDTLFGMLSSGGQLSTNMSTTTCCGNNNNSNNNNSINIVHQHHLNVTPVELTIGQRVVNDQDMYLFGIIGMMFMCHVIIVFGVIANVINMAVFYRAGFKDTINISLFALAISDMLSCVTMIPCTVPFSPELLGQSLLPVNWFEVGHITGAWPHVAFTKITTLITAFITVERCLCVFMPLKVKLLVTRTKVIAYLIASYSFVLTLLACLCYSNQLGWKHSPLQNRSVLGLVFPKEREDIEKVVLPIINAVISVFAFVLIIISTLVLVITLKRKAQWRLGVTSTSINKSNNTTTTSTSTTTKTGDNHNTTNPNITATKEHKISKMVVMISTVFIASLFPSVVTLLLLWADRRFDFGGPYTNLFVIIVSCTYTLEMVNASINIFIYYNNSSNYKTVFNAMFCSKSGTKSKL